MLLLPLAEKLAKRALTSRGVESRFVKSSVALHHVYDARGTGHEPLPTVVLLHGINSSAAIFAQTIGRLRKHSRRVLAVEAPGHGMSSAPNVALSPQVLFESMAEVLSRELSEPAIVCGNSLGGAVAISLGIHHSTLVRGLFLTSPAGARMNDETFRGFLDVFNLKSNGEARAFMRRIYHRPPWFTALIAPEVRTSFSRKAVRDILEGADADHLFSQDELHQLAMPIHILWGKSDKLLPRENLTFYRASMPSHATVEEPEGIGHCPHFDDPAGYSAKIIEFGKRVMAHQG